MREFCLWHYIYTVIDHAHVSVRICVQVLLVEASFERGCTIVCNSFFTSAERMQEHVRQGKSRSDKSLSSAKTFATSSIS